MKKISLGISGAGPRTAILATTLTMTLIAVANAQSGDEKRQRDAAAARIYPANQVVPVAVLSHELFGPFGADRKDRRD